METQESAIKEQISLEKMLYGDSPDFGYREIMRKDFLVDLFGLYPKLRPHYIASFVSFCSYYLTEDSFRKIILRKTFAVCPTLIHRLYKMNFFSDDEIKECLMMHKRKFLYLYYMNDIVCDYNQFNDDQYSLKYWNEKELGFLITNGFYPSSIELSLKHDRLEDMQNLFIKRPEITNCIWSPFEWSKEPSSLDYLSFSGFFGSIKCFRFLLLSNFLINEQVICNAVCGGSIEILNQLIDLNFGFNSFINEASCFHHLHLIEFMNKNGANIDLKNKKGFSPLHYAAQYGHLSVIEYLVKNGANINLRNNRFMTPLQIASENRFLTVDEYLINHGAYIDDMICGENYIHWASRNGYLSILISLLDHGAEIHSKNGDYKTPFQIASEKGHLDVVEYLINHGANIQDEIYDESCLHWASRNGYLSIILCLLNQGVFIDSINDNQETPLHLSSGSGHINIVEYLLDNGSDLNAKNKWNETPIHCSARNGHLSVVEYLFHCGADINTRNNILETPLHSSSKNGHLSVVEYLVNHGADINAKTEFKDTPLHYSAKKNFLSIVDFLIKNGADTNPQNVWEQTPIFLSFHCGHYDIVEYLIKYIT